MAAISSFIFSQAIAGHFWHVIRVKIFVVSDQRLLPLVVSETDLTLIAIVDLEVFGDQRGAELWFATLNTDPFRHKQSRLYFYFVVSVNGVDYHRFHLWLRIDGSDGSEGTAWNVSRRRIGKAVDVVIRFLLRVFQMEVILNSFLTNRIASLTQLIADQHFNNVIAK